MAMRNDDLDIRELYNSLPFWRKVKSFLHMNHYLFWKVTLMDITILFVVSLAVGFALSKCTALSAEIILLIILALILLIEFIRIKTRTLRGIQYNIRNCLKAQAHLQKHAEQMKAEGKTEVYEKTLEALEKLQNTIKTFEEYAELVYREDILNHYGDEDE